LEILRLMGTGLLNREIGDKLGMTEGSVKWYVQQIYDKVGVRRRAQVVERAYQLGLISR
jgi:LuxR family maltose regulon positive regulatory protein